MGPLFIDRWILVARKKDQIKISSLEDAKKVKSIGTYLNDVRDEFLKKKGFTNIDTALENAMNAKKLETGRISLWILSAVDLPILCKQENVDINSLEVVFRFEGEETFLAFSKETSPSIVKRWQKAFHSMVEDGTWKRLNPDQ